MAELTCSGRAVDDHLQHAGHPCGRRLRAHGQPVDQVARAAGWLLAPDGTGTCPGCRRPAPEVLALIRQVDDG